MTSPHFYERPAATSIIEFVPKTDSQVRRMLSVREDIFPHYNVAGFEQAFKQHFEISELLQRSQEPTALSIS